jgi:hypothetical protein
MEKTTEAVWQEMRQPLQRYIAKRGRLRLRRGLLLLFWLAWSG